MSSAEEMSAGGNDEMVLRLKEENMQLKLDMERNEKEKMQMQLQYEREKNEREKSELILKYERSELQRKEKEYEKKGKEIAKLKGSLVTKEKLLSLKRAEVGRRIISEQQADAKIEVLQRELEVLKQPTIQHIMKAYDEVEDIVDIPLFDLYEHIMSLSDEKLFEETKFIVDKDGSNVLALASMYGFPHAALSRLVQCGCDINAEDTEGDTALVIAAENNRLAAFDSLALLGADLSVLSKHWGKDFLEEILGFEKVPPESAPKFRSLFKFHGIGKKKKIADGFVSPLKGKESSMPELHLLSVMKLQHTHERATRIISLPIEKLREEARERDEDGIIPLHCAASNVLPLRLVQRLQLAYPAAVNARDKWDQTPLMEAVRQREVGNVDLLLEMGSCVSLRDDTALNAFDLTAEGKAFDGEEDEEKRVAIIAVFKKHGVTSSTIAANYHSPLYFTSIYFKRRVAHANWAKHGMTLMCMEVIDVKYRKRGEAALSYLTKGARNFFKAFALVDGTDGLGNPFARIILTYLGGESDRVKLTREPLLKP
jgi:ankyrin repeat protein